MTPTIHHGDCLEVLRQMPDNSVHAIVTDPPYGLSNTTPEQVAETIVKWVSGERDYLPSGRGFMNRAWDAFVPPVAVWDECMRVLKPGGHVLAFAGTRTVDLMTLGLRLAGFDIRDSVLWVFGSGFPKSHNVSKAIDKMAGAEREVIGRYESPEGTTGANSRDDAYGFGVGDMSKRLITAPATDAAKQWEGWGSALKPATEPIVWARKPFSLVPLNGEVNRLHHLIGGLVWLSLSPAKRAELTSTSSPAEQHGTTCVSALVSAAMDTSHAESAKTDTFNSQAAASTSWSIASSWSAILDALSAQTRTSTTATKSSTTTGLKTLNSLLGPITSQTTMPACECLTGGARSTAQNAESSSSDAWMRWLNTLSASVPETATEGIALAAASALASIAEEFSAGQEAERTAGESATTRAAASSGGLTEPIVMARKPFKGTLAANVLEHGTGAINVDATRIGGESGRWPANVILDEHCAGVLDQQSGNVKGVLGGMKQTGGNVTFTVGEEINRKKFTPSAERIHDEGGASRFFYVAKRDERGAISPYFPRDFDPPFMYAPKAPKKERPEVDGVKHPTVKPVSLMRWLVRLVTPPSGTILEPFAGSGTTIEAAMLEGFDVIGIEREAEYLPLIHERIRRATEQLATEDPEQGSFSFEETA